MSPTTTGKQCVLRYTKRMNTKGRLSVATGFTLALLALVSADALYMGGLQGMLTTVVPEEETSGVTLAKPLNVEERIAALGITPVAGTEANILSQIAEEGWNIETRVLLHEEDRSGFIAWVQNPDAKTIFSGLKEALIESFSPEVAELNDQTIKTPNGPVRNILTFIDPKLSPERLVFVRIRENLYEFHVPLGKEDIMIPFIADLTEQ